VGGIDWGADVGALVGRDIGELIIIGGRVGRKVGGWVLVLGGSG
jgi:hypothetical protein